MRSRIKSVIAAIEDEGNVKINRQELAATLDITPVYLSNIISGKKVPNTELVFKLAKILERKVDDLYIYEEE
ncbi:helix-turn-helix transcriptional regulator [Paenibacillus pectinilyticus]|uniref:helix-turn-helix transcriptional regulator n=1 Tax=Paenibacillus pectinilyticus TaxID=512399 RepID=UPI001ABF8D2E|nr:helix-turn-helix transcriptional regulator [Paenibacillus pectinilyticus]